MSTVTKLDTFTLLSYNGTQSWGTVCKQNRIVTINLFGCPDKTFATGTKYDLSLLDKKYFPMLNYIDLYNPLTDSSLTLEFEENGNIVRLIPVNKAIPSSSGIRATISYIARYK